VVVVGAGPNGLAAAIRLAQTERKVLLLEASDTIGGGARSAELTLPGFLHDVCSAVHPLGIGSPFFRQLPLANHGLEWVQPKLPLAHVLDGGGAVVLNRSVSETAAQLGRDARPYRRLMASLANHSDELANELLGPMLHWPRHPFLLAKFARRGFRTATSLARRWFKEEPAKALFAGLAAHSFLALDEMPSSAFGIVLAVFAHFEGWPMPRGGSGMLSHALAEHFKELGGEIVVNAPIQALRDLPSSPITILDVAPRNFLRIADRQITKSYRTKLEAFRNAPGVFKIDYALSGAIPWTAAECAQAGTIHLGGTFDEIARAEKAVTTGSHPEQPFVLLAQPTLFDNTRAPNGKHIAWVYAHVPNGSTVDMTDRIERQIERFAPGFRQLVLARHTMNCSDLERRNWNLVGGDINGGAADLWQLIARPILSLCPYRTCIPGVYLCSASTPPGGGVHGMCGFHAANAALKDGGR